ncbi:DUF3419 family protein [Corallococcus llansteffanensis]|uniref:DUF3419 family protein n=1 Tax=Corallococcus llansteffanensis TaxID=2316731 RepID=A0A3A8QE35_9BACT|nr:DUF3419 family protein [Corallococcus llansteffanensis]RKH65861.1 DUF3419 family protein [Corallococcus llansteffanensis]
MAGTYFRHLNYALGDEDSSVELQVLPPDTGRVVAVAGSGGRVIPLLARGPRELSCVDISDTQLALTELRVCALRTLEHPEYLGLLGYEPMPVARRLELLGALPLSPGARGALEPLKAAVAAGERIIYLGRFEQMLRTLSRVNGLLTRAAGRRLFDAPDLDAQRAYVTSGFPRSAWKGVLLLLGNSAVLNSLLYRGDFPKKNRPGSTFRIYQELFDRLFQDTPARKSFFLQMVFLGELRFAEGFPIEADPAVYRAAQRHARKCRIDFIQGDLVEEVRKQRDVGFVSLSDVPSFLPPAREQTFLEELKPGLAPGALVVTRGHLRVVTPGHAGYAHVTDRYQDVLARETTQLWTIHVYQREPSGAAGERFQEDLSHARGQAEPFV